MGSETPLQLPKIDFSAEGSLVPGSHGWEVVRLQVREALESYGCFEAVYDGISPELQEDIVATMKEVFALPLETKQLNLAGPGYGGYIGQFPGLAYESVGSVDLNLPQVAQSFTHIFWPEGNPSFCESVYGYAKKLSELDQTVRKMVLESLGVEKFYQSQLESSRYFVRLSEYGRNTQSGAVKLGLAAHIDPNIITIIHQNEVGGLEVQTKDGDWIPFDASGPNSFVVMTGASFRAWSNGRLHAPVHRVITSGEWKKTRYSVLLNSIHKNDAVVEAPEELVDEEHPRLFKPFKYIDFCNYALSPEGYQAKCQLTAYCGLAATAT